MKKLLKKLFVTMFLIMALASLTVFSFSCFAPKIEFVYTLIDGGKAYELTECKVTLSGRVEDRTITVPSTYKGLPVKGIGERCFYDKGDMGSMFKIEKLYLPTTIEYVKDGAFLGQSRIEVYIQDLTDWCNISFESYSANPLSGAEASSLWDDEANEYENVYGANLYLNGELVENLVIPSSITKIKDYAFFGGSFKSVNLGNQITEIGAGAFAACANLESVNIPSSVETIGERAFSTTNILQLFVGENVSQIGDHAFSGANHLVEVVNNSKTLTFTRGASDNGGVTQYALGIYNREEFLGSKIKEENGDVIYVEEDEKYLIIADYDGETKTVADGITAILRRAFTDAYKVAEVIIPRSVSKIAETAFEGMKTAVAKYYGTAEDWCNIDGIVNLTASVKEVSLENLTSATISVPTWMTEIPEGFLKKCKNVEKVILHENVKSISSGSFTECKSLKSINLPAKVEKIGKEAFSYCENLQGELKLPTALKELGNYAFSHCRSLVGTVEIPLGVTEIKQGAFSGCTGISNVVLHEGVVSIETFAFADCTGITGAFYLPLSVKEIGMDAFGESGITTLQYAGTQRQFWAIQLAPAWNSENTVKTVICTDGEMRVVPEGE